MGRINVFLTSKLLDDLDAEARNGTPQATIRKFRDTNLKGNS